MHGQGAGTVWDGEETQIWILGLRKRLLGILHLAHMHFHVRLARADPHLADVNVFEMNGIIAANGHLIGPARFEIVQLHLPMMIRGGARDLAALKLDGGLFALLSGSPDGLPPASLAGPYI